MTSSNITGLILIDCWEPSIYYSKSSRLRLAKQKFFTDLTHNLKQFNFSGTIVSGTQDIETSSIIQAYLPIHNTVYLTTQTEFFELRKKNQNFKQIKHWLVVGEAWQICAHLNDMGLCSFYTMMRQHPKLNFYGAPWGFLKYNLETTTAKDFANDYLPWVPHGVLYKLSAEPDDNGQSVTHPTVAIRNKYIDETPHQFN